MATPTDEDMTTRAVSATELRRIRLAGADVEVTSGNEVGAKVAIGAGGACVGSGVGCDLRLSDPLVSRRHVDLFAEANGVRVVDRGSLNGTHLGSVRVREMILTESATLRAGETMLEVHLLGEPLVVELSSRTGFGEAIAHSPAMRHVFELLERAARNDVTVLLEGESGTGKDVLARSLHRESRRREGPFVVVDCGAIPHDLVESELFGHEKGAFTGAVASREGAFEQANGGTIFLDEVGELPLDAQPKLLRALEDRSVRRVGGRARVQLDVRVVAATNRRLGDAVRRREFREDLFYRLAVVHVAVPRLAERREDIAPLGELFLRRVTGRADASLPPDLLRLLAAYDWPGNARELRNVIERFATFDRADASLLFGGRAAPTRGPGFDLDALAGLSYHDAKRRVVDAFHRAILPRAVDAAGGSVPKAADALGLPKGSLYRMLQALSESEGGEPHRGE